MPSPGSPRVLAVIPARFASTRLPGKPLADLCGRPLIQHVWERVKASPGLSRVVVATDDARIATVARGFGADVAMTSPSCTCGTERVAEAAAAFEADIVLNVQGDEPFVESDCLVALIAAFADEDVRMATLSREAAPGEIDDPNVVKVVCDRRGDALYFSRRAIPYIRSGAACPTRAHVGLYAYRREFLAAAASLVQTPLEQAESLEQLRVLEHGWRIRVVPVAYSGFGVDTPEDLERARRLLASRTAVP